MRNLEHLNKAILFKQVWRMHSNKELLVSIVFRVRYKEDWFKRSLEGRIPQGTSWGGRSIMKSVHQMAIGVGHIIGNGKSVRIGDGNWAGPDPLSLDQIWELKKLNQHGLQI